MAPEGLDPAEEGGIDEPIRPTERATVRDGWEVRGSRHQREAHRTAHVQHGDPEGDEALGAQPLEVAKLQHREDVANDPRDST